MINMIISKTTPAEATELETIYKEAFASNVFPDNMIETEDGDEEEDLSLEVAIKRDDLISLSIYHNGKLVGGAILDCTNFAKTSWNACFYLRQCTIRGWATKHGGSSSGTIQKSVGGCSKRRPA